MIELAILGLLRDQDLHGYELRKRLADVLGPGSSVSYGSLYPALSRLERAGRVEAVDEPPAAPRGRLTMPMTGALSGEVTAFRRRSSPERGSRKRPPRGRRNRKVYAITRDGEQRLRDLLVDPAIEERAGNDDRVFALKVAFCKHLPSPRRLELFERRRAELGRRLEQRTQPAPAAADGTADSYMHAVREREALALTQDLEWLDRLIADEREALDRAGPERAGATGSST